MFEQCEQEDEVRGESGPAYQMCLPSCRNSEEWMPSRRQLVSVLTMETPIGFVHSASVKMSITTGTGEPVGTGQGESEQVIVCMQCVGKSEERESAETAKDA